MKKTIGRDLPNGDYIEIEAEEHDGSNDHSPGFAVTGTVYEKHGTWDGRARKRNGRDMDMGGMLHNLVLQAAPELAPIVQVHLADPNGKPMHALANSWYFYTGASAKYERERYGEDYAKRHGTPHEQAARALHIPPADLPEGLDEAGFEEFVASLTTRWAEQANAARDALAAMVDGDGVED